jgi:hypothetical protein
MLLVSGGTKTVDRIDDPRLGVLLRPGNGNKPGRKPWAADNGAYAGFDVGAYLRMLGALAGKPGCLWVTAPDVVCNADATLKLFDVWEPMLHACGFPVAFVAQNGIGERTPWDRIECLFVGGDDAFKLGAESRFVVREAKRRGKLVHVGRVNTLGRIGYAHDIGADSFDGTAASQWPDIKIPWFLEHMASLAGTGRQLFLDELTERRQA